jgi:hypothetical protein
MHSLLLFIKFVNNGVFQKIKFVYLPINLSTAIQNWRTDEMLFFMMLSSFSSVTARTRRKQIGQNSFNRMVKRTLKYTVNSSTELKNFFKVRTWVSRLEILRAADSHQVYR